MIKKLLIWLGYRSPCCYAEVVDVPGWGQTYCAKCEKRLS